MLVMDSVVAWSAVSSGQRGLLDMEGPYLVLQLGDMPESAKVFETCDCAAEFLLEHCADFDSALARLHRRDFDLILADYRTAEFGEIESLRAIRTVRPSAKVIVVVDESTPEKVITALQENAFSYFSRPLDPRALRDMICHALRVSEWDDGIEVVSADPRFLSLRLRCRLSTADRLLQFLKELKADMPEEERIQAAMAFRELLINAIEHGGKLNPNERVRVSRVRTRRTLVFHIDDPGEGFSRADLPHSAISNPNGLPAGHMQVREELGLRPGGFGLLVASQMVDEVIYNERGNEVLLIKHLD